MSGKGIHLVVAVLVAGFASMSLGQGLDPNLVGWWRFDEGAGTVAADSSGRGFHGTLLSNPVWRTDGVRNGCLFFDGYEAYVRIAQQPPLNPGTGSFTVLFWSNIDTTPGTRGDTTWDLAVNKRDTGSVGYYVGAQRTQGGGAGKTGYRFMLGGASRTDTPFVPVPLDEWVFVAAVVDRGQNAQKISVDGGLNWAATTPPASPIAPAQDLAIGWDIGPNNYWFRGRIDEVALFNRALSNGEIGLIRQKGMTPALADSPQPKNNAADLPRDVTLSWSPGLYAATHDVYVGTSRADVTAASRANPLGVLVSRGQAALTCDLSDLTLGQTYYWRVDEVNAPPTAAIFKGEVWSFTVEPVGYPLAAKQITATASSSSSADEGPANTVNGSGLNADDRHAVDTTKMWLSGAVGAGQSVWIRYEFDKVYSLYQMVVWNHNGVAEPLIGFGIKEAVVEYSLDGSAWQSLGDRQTFARAPGKADTGPGTIVDFGGVTAKFVRITALSNWGGVLPQYGLSEVRFLYIPLAARGPSPASGATGLEPLLTLSWRPGRQAARHDVYLSTDQQKVIDGTAPVQTVLTPRFDTGMLALGETYYWKVNEVNEAAPTPVWKGELWSFETQEYLVVDDFESYTNDEGSRIYETWIDGWENKTGSQVGYLEAPFAERTIVQNGRQSLPLKYTNTSAPFYSEAERFFDAPQDWTLYGVATLTIHFRGTVGNEGKLYAKINNTKVPYSGDAGDIAKVLWQAWSIDLAAVGINLKSVRSLTIGVEGANATGTVYIDDIRLYPRPPETAKGVEPDRARLVAHYAFNGDTADSSGNNYHGTAAGGPTFVAGVRGQALQCDGVDDHVRVAHHAQLNPGAGSFSFAFWAYLDMTRGTSGSTNWDLAIAKRDVGARGYYVGADRNQGTASQAGFKLMLGNTTGTRVDTPFALVPLGEWVFVAAVVDRENNEHKISVDGGQTWKTAKPPAGQVAPAMDLGLGWDIGVKDFWFRGMIDEVRLYNKALSDEEVTWLAAGR